MTDQDAKLIGLYATVRMLAHPTPGTPMWRAMYGAYDAAWDPNDAASEPLIMEHGEDFRHQRQEVISNLAAFGWGLVIVSTVLLLAVIWNWLV